MAEFEAIMIIVSKGAVLCLPLVISVCIGMHMFLFFYFAEVLSISWMISGILILLVSRIAVFVRMSRKFLGLEMAICIFL